MLTINQTPVLNHSLGLVAKEILQYLIICNEKAVNTEEYRKHDNHFCKSFQDFEMFLDIKRDQAKAAISKLESMALIDVVINKGGNGYRVNMNTVEELYNQQEIIYKQQTESYVDHKKQVKTEAKQRLKDMKESTPQNFEIAKAALEDFRNENISQEDAINVLEKVGCVKNSDMYNIVALCVMNNIDLSYADYNTIKKHVHESFGNTWTTEAYLKLEEAIKHIGQVSFSKHFGTAVKNYMRGYRNFTREEVAI